ncbi:MAG: homoserine dehydrogenase [Anaerolineae bacterium]|nr:homoserine dehydrogenase [Anaerolineae bacterium]
MPKRIRLALIGLGNVGRGFLELLTTKQETLRTRYGLELVVTAAADTSGAALDARGLDAALLLVRKRAGQGAATYPVAGRPGLSALDTVRRAHADVLLEASLTNLKDGEPGLSCIRTALTRGLHAVTANKGPLVHAYPELVALAQERGAGLGFSAAVCGALPTVNIGRRDLVACAIARIEGIFNSTTHYILTSMAEGRDYATALREAQEEGVAEADPTLDVEGWDAANKLVILANSVLGIPATLADVAVEGITRLTPNDFARAQAEGKVIKLLCTAAQEEAGYRLSVRPTPLPRGHPLVTLRGWQMGIVYHTDIMGVQFAAVDERGPVPTAAAMLRDVVNLV